MFAVRFPERGEFIVIGNESTSIASSVNCAVPESLASGVGAVLLIVNVTGIEDPLLGIEINILPLDCPETETVLALVLFDTNIVFVADVLTV